MKKIEIIGDNYFGKWDKTRTACRGIVIREDRILLCHEAVTGLWMIPGGGLEGEESENVCCVRETAEETGYLIETSDCVLQINEYYEDWNYVSYYFLGTVLGQTERKLTVREEEVGMEAEWVPLKEAIDLFSKHASYADTDEMKRGIYLREYLALSELFPEMVRE